eukprot:1442554-Pleurochrysis_carterae.AAC.2
MKILVVRSPVFYTSLSLNDVNSANHHPFPGHEPTMPGFESNNLAHRQPLAVKELPGFDSNHPITTPGVIFDLQDVGHVGRCSPGREQWR